MLVQLPNEQDFLPMDIDMNLFKEDKRTDNIRWGWYNGVYIGVKEMQLAGVISEIK